MEFILIKGNKSFGFWVLGLYKNGFGKLILKPFYV